ncbi:hypothetical protein GEMRC1_006203 [Eukaryota sp. GEM-RC1]
MTAQSHFQNIPQGAPDKILSLVFQYLACNEPNKINVSIGAFRDDNGKPVVLDVVREAEQDLVEAKHFFEYSPIDGTPAFQKLSAELLFGLECPLMKANRLVSMQSVAGSGALAVGFEFIRQYLYGRHIYTSTPTWPNHIAMLETRFPAEMLKKYRYFDTSTALLDFDGMMEDLRNAQDGSVVLLQPICHNPTGVDPTREQWKEICELCIQKNFIVFQDCAYQGFGSGDLDEDAWAIRHFAERAAETGMEIICSYSFSKNMGLYAQRIGALHVACSKADVVEPVRSQLKRIVRTMYSSPPVQGERLVVNVLSDERKYKDWKIQLKQMTDRILHTRKALYDGLIANETPGSWEHVIKQCGMFSYTGLTAEQSAKMKNERFVFLTEDGRISIAGINPSNVNYMADSIKAVVSEN